MTCKPYFNTDALTLLLLNFSGQNRMPLKSSFLQ